LQADLLEQYITNLAREAFELKKADAGEKIACF